MAIAHSTSALMRRHKTVVHSCSVSSLTSRMTEHGSVADHRTELFIIIGRRACRPVIDLSFITFSQHFVLKLTGGNCECIATWGGPTSRQSAVELLTLSNIFVLHVKSGKGWVKKSSFTYDWTSVIHFCEPRSSKTVKLWQLRMHCNLRPPDVMSVVLGCVFFSILNCYFPASDQNSGIAIRCSNLAIRRRFHAVTLTCIHLTLNPRVSYSDLKIYNLGADRTLDFTVCGFQSLRGLCSL